jgi:hypothetical protein
VDTHRTIHIGIAIGEGFDVGGVFSTDADAQEMPDPALARRFEGGVKGACVLGKVKTVKVAMGIYEHKKVRLEITVNVRPTIHPSAIEGLTAPEQANPLHQQRFKQ